MRILQFVSSGNHLIQFAIVAAISLQNCFAKNPVCNTKECKHLGDLYLHNLDPNGKPCENFYNYACHGWGQKYSKSFHYSFWDTEEEMEDKVYQDLKQLMEDEHVPPEKEFQQAKALYKACMKPPHFQAVETSGIKEVLKRVVPWPMLHLTEPQILSTSWMIDKQYLQITGESVFFNYLITSDENDHSKIITELRRPVTPYGILLRLVDWDKPELQHYALFIDQIIQKVATNYDSLPKTMLMNDLRQLMQFREELRTAIKQSHPQITVEMTIEDFQDWYDSLILPDKRVEINWLQAVRAIHNSNDPHNSKISEDTKIKVHKRYFIKLANLLSKTDKRVLVNHIHLHFVERHLIFTPEMLKTLQGSFHDGVHSTGKIVYQPKRWRTCLEDHNMRQILGQMYVQKYFSQQKATDASKLIEKAKRLLVHQISHTNWLNAATKEQTIAKIQDIQSVIGYSESYKPGSPKPRYKKNDLNPIEVDVYYKLGENRMYVTAADLHLPIYGQNVPYPIDYGATISTFGHELYHAIDQDGINFDKRGSKPWWTTYMQNQHEQQMICIKNKYAAYRNKEIKKRGLASTMPFPSTADEDLADAMGLKLAYIGFKEEMQKHKGVCQVLPGFEKYTCEKLFFLAFANLYCTYATPSYEDRFLVTQRHSLPEIRVNGAVANMPEFSEAFGCKAKDPLNLHETCDFWKR